MLAFMAWGGWVGADTHLALMQTFSSANSCHPAEAIKANVQAHHARSKFTRSLARLLEGRSSGRKHLGERRNLFTLSETICGQGPSFSSFSNSGVLD